MIRWRDRQTNRQAGKQTGRKTNRQTEKETHVYIKAKKRRPVLSPGMSHGTFLPVKPAVKFSVSRHWSLVFTGLLSVFVS